MTAKKENLMKFAKGDDKKAKTPAKKKEVAEKVLTPEEERDLKAKEKVATLLEGVDLTLKKGGDDLLEIDTPPKENGDYQWLEEQVQKLTEENERLNSEAAVAKADYAKIFETYQQLKNGAVSGSPENGDNRLKVIQLFNEIQANYVSMGKNFIIHPPSFLLRLIMFFPFLENERRF